MIGRVSEKKSVNLSHLAMKRAITDTRACFLKQSFFIIYNPGQISWDTTHQYNTPTRQIEASSLSHSSSGAVLMLCIQVLIQHNQHCMGERGTADKPTISEHTKCKDVVVA